VDGSNMEVVVHRKGATRAFAAGRREITQKYRDVGQPVIIPGDMSSGTYVLLGQKGAMGQTFGSTCHGAGRKMSRTSASHGNTATGIRKDLADRDIVLLSGSDEGLTEEAPDAYKDIDTVIEVVCGAGISSKVAKLSPIGVVKG
ncbi:MAG: RtcB family protein, partial [Candidatus Methanomethylophilaceae archaeon]